ncbi:MAG: hypothetical protein IPH18_05350 [Chitinophagaceae bacterium]|nr:hypothetical protein [Chitinophagaceae bacterium]
MSGKNYPVQGGGHINELQFAANSIAVAEVAGKKICVGRYNDKLFAFAYKCHMRRHSGYRIYLMPGHMWFIRYPGISSACRMAGM